MKLIHLLRIILLTLSLSLSDAFGADFIYVTDQGDNTIQKIDQDGNATVFASLHINEPAGLAFDKSGNLYVANTGDNTIYKFDPSGNGTLFASAGLHTPIGLTFDSLGNLYAANAEGSTVTKFDSNGNGTLFASTNLANPVGIACDVGNNIYVANYYLGTIIKFDTNGNGTVFATLGVKPDGLCFDHSDNLFVAGSDNGSILKIDPSGNVSVFASSTNLFLNNPIGLVFDEAGNLYEANYWYNTVGKFNPNGQGAVFASTSLSKPTFLATYDSGHCTPPPSGLAGWWPAEGNANDIIGTNNGSLLGNVTYANGEVGQAFKFNAVGDQVSVPTGGFPVGTNDRTMECWVYINSFVSGEGALFAFYGTTDIGGAYGFGAFSDQRLYFSQWGGIIFGPVLTTGQWYHVAVTSTGGVSTLYLNGTNVASGNLPFNTPAGSQLLIGGINVQFANYQTIGLIDELSIYNRALSQQEIQAIYNAGSQGKCISPVSPQIITQPVNQTVFVGQPASFNVLASGTPSLTYQWNFNSNNIVGATNATLNLSSVMSTNAGNYNVLVSNGLGSILSSNAILTVPSCTPPVGIVGWWPAEGNANDIIGTNNGSLLGNVTYANGEVGQAFKFNAVGDQVSVPTGGFPVGTNDRTMECWVYINSFVSGEGALFAFYGTTDIGGAYGFGAFSDQRLYFSQWGGIIFGPVLTTGQWYHVAVTSTGSVSTLYLNGTNVASGNLPFNTPAGSQLLIGGINVQFANYQTIGLIDELSIYNRALSQQEIQAIYNAGSQGKCNLPPYIPPPRTATATAQWAGIFVVGVNITDGGTGYTNTPLVRFIGGGGTNAQASVVLSNGVVVGINIVNPGSGYTNAPVVVIDPPFIANPILGITSISMLNFTNLIVGTNYQLQQFNSVTWVNQSAAFQATTNFYTTIVPGSVSGADYRLTQVPVPVQATAFAQVVNGFVVGGIINNQGSGYVTPPNVAIVANNGSNAVATASVSGGSVTSINIVSPGSGYVNPVTFQIDPPPATALLPMAMLGVTLKSSSLAPYDDYQIQFKPDVLTTWGDLSGGLFVPTSTVNSQNIFLTNNAGFFRLQYVP